MRIAIVATAAVAGAFIALSGVGVAHAGTTRGDGGIVNGDQVSVPIAISVDDCGDVIALLGFAAAGCAGAERAAGVSWDGGVGLSAERTAGVSWDSGFILDAKDIGSQTGVPAAMPAGGCANSAGYDPSSCQGGAAERKQPVMPLSAPSPCPCLPPQPCPCLPLAACPCGASPSLGHHVSPHKPLRHPVPHISTTAATSRAHGTPTPIVGELPITGANLAGLTVSALGLLGTGAGALYGAARVTTRRRRRGSA
jgi:ChpA-C